MNTGGENLLARRFFMGGLRAPRRRSGSSPRIADAAPPVEGV
jgi:hypothetical protein